MTEAKRTRVKGEKEVKELIRQRDLGIVIRGSRIWDRLLKLSPIAFKLYFCAIGVSDIRYRSSTAIFSGEELRGISGLNKIEFKSALIELSKKQFIELKEIEQDQAEAMCDKLNSRIR